MSLAPTKTIGSALGRRLPALAQALKAPFATRAADPLETDTRTTKSQKVAHETDEATKDSIRHAAEGNFTEAVKDVGNMAKNAAKGAAASAKLMYDSEKKQATGKGASVETKEDLKQGK